LGPLGEAIFGSFIYEKKTDEHRNFLLTIVKMSVCAILAVSSLSLKSLLPFKTI